MEKASIHDVMSEIWRFVFLGMCDKTNQPLNQSCGSGSLGGMFSANKSSKLTHFPEVILETPLQATGE